MKKGKIFILSIFFLFAVSLFLPDSLVLADAKSDAIQQLKASGGTSGYGTDTTDPRIVAAQIVQSFMGLLGSVFIFLFVYSGYLLITSHGDSEKVSKARKTMTGAIIGILVTLLSFSIANFVGKNIQDVANQDVPQMSN
ncbi:MAG: hypothetical protein WC070_02585 [Candidatus Magasanikbacteria bacterium]